MNKIKVVEETVESKLSKKISFTVKEAKSELEISELTIQIVKDSDLELDFSCTSKKWKINVEVLSDVHSQFYVYQKAENSKIQYNLKIHSNASLQLFKFQMNANKEMMEVRLLGEGASMDYFLKDIAFDKETMDYYIFHDAPRTSSNIKNNVVTTQKGRAVLQVSTFIPKGMKECIASQANRIINNNEMKNEIRPNLYIEEYDVTANHSALIGRFREEELFYLESRGIDEQQASRLLLEGFLLSDITNKKMRREILKSTKKEWR